MSFWLLQLSDLISVELLSGTSATLSFRCDDESVQLPLSALSNMNPSKEMVRIRLSLIDDKNKLKDL